MEDGGGVGGAQQERAMRRCTTLPATAGNLTAHWCTACTSICLYSLLAEGRGGRISSLSDKGARDCWRFLLRQQKAYTIGNDRIERPPAPHSVVLTVTRGWGSARRLTRCRWRRGPAS